MPLLIIATIIFILFTKRIYPDNGYVNGLFCGLAF